MAAARLRADLKKLDGAIVGRIARIIRDPSIRKCVSSVIIKIYTDQ